MKGSLPASIIAMIGIVDSPEPTSPAKTTVTSNHSIKLLYLILSLIFCLISGRTTTTITTIQFDKC